MSGVLSSSGTLPSIDSVPKLQRVPFQTVADLCRRLAESGVFTQQQIEDFLETPAGWRSASDTHGFMDAMVGKGLLTEFQRDEIRNGRLERLRLGPYVLLDRLDEGGLGAAYRASHVNLDRNVVIKLFNPGLAKHEEVLHRFQREVASSAKLDGPNLLRASDVFRTNDCLALVLECTNGPNLFELVKRHGPLPLAIACDCVSQAATALEVIHRLEMIHRDVKPSNLLLVPSEFGATNRSWGTVKLLDMGLVRLLRENAVGETGRRQAADAASETVATTPDASPENDNATWVAQRVGMLTDAACSAGAGSQCGPIPIPGPALGTIEFMAPEQAVDAHEVDCRADLYSLGSTLFFLLTGRSVFGEDGHTVMKLLRLTQQTPPRVRTYRLDCPTELDELVAQLLSKRVEDRPLSARTVAEALDRLADRLAGCSKGPAMSVVMPGAQDEPIVSERTGPAARFKSRLAELARDIDSWQRVAEEFEVRKKQAETELNELREDKSRALAELTAVHDELRRQKGELADANNRISQLQADVAATAQEATRSRAEQTAAQEKALQLESVMEQLNTELEARRRKLVEHAESLGGVQRALSKKTELVVELETKLDKQSAALEQANRMLANKNELQLAKHNERIRELEGRLALQATELHKVREELAERIDASARLGAETADRDRRISSFDTQLKENAALIDQMQTQLAQRLEQSGQYEHELSQREDRIRDLELKVEQCRQTIRELQSEIEERRTESTHATEELLSKSNCIRQLESQISNHVAEVTNVGHLLSQRMQHAAQAKQTLNQLADELDRVS